MNTHLESLKAEEEILLSKEERIKKKDHERVLPCIFCLWRKMESGVGGVGAVENLFRLNQKHVRKQKEHNKTN